MEIIYTRLIEIGAIFITGILIYIIDKIKSNIKFKKLKKEWIDNSFEYNDIRYSKEYFYMEDGKIKHTL